MMAASEYRLPPPVRARTAYVAALASPIQQVLLERGCATLRERGWTVTVDEAISARDWLTAGSPDIRLAALRRWRDGDAEVLMVARGGYGTMQLLPLPDSLDQPRWIAGSSDATALQAFLMARFGWGSLYAPMVCGGLARDPAPETLERLDKAAELRESSPLAAGEALVRGEAEGFAVGGCLSMLAALVGSGWLPPARGAILFLEDIGEAPYRLERMLLQLRNHGWLDGIRGVVLGTFPGCAPVAGSGYTLAGLFRRFFAPLGVPVYFGYPFGHVEDGRPCDTIVLGARYILDEKGPFRPKIA